MRLAISVLANWATLTVDYQLVLVLHCCLQVSIAHPDMRWSQARIGGSSVAGNKES